MSKTIAVLYLIALWYMVSLGERIKSPCTLKSCKITKNPAKWPGERGKPVILDEDEQLEADDSFSEHYFNLVVSDKIALNRSIPGIPIPACYNKRYNVKNFPQVSVIIVYFNEAFSTLMRSIFSVINRTPAELLKEIILVDDGSFNNTFISAVEEAIKDYETEIIISKLEERQGLIAAKIHGAKLARAKVLVFLDSHVEVNVRWLEPLLHEISINPKAVPCPIIDIIKYDTFEYLYGSDQVWGEFDWYLVFKWNGVPENIKTKRTTSPTSSYRSPEMAGGIFAIDRDYFFKMGTYDDEIKWWGAENLEMSLRIWQCGGQILIVPCSRVGHVYREKNPHEFPGGQDYVLLRNYGRVAEVWLDEYKEIFYAVNAGYQDLGIDLGNLSDRFALRKKLGCKDFNWYLKNIFTTSTFPLDFRFVTTLKNIAFDECVDISNHEASNNEISLSQCQGLNSMQTFVVTDSGKIRNNNLCLEASSNKKVVRLLPCTQSNKRQKWEFVNKENETIIKHSATKLCLTVDGEIEKLALSPCTDDNLFLWQFENKKMRHMPSVKEEL